MTAEDLKNLQYGERVYRFVNGEARRLDFVGFMPSCLNYLIFSDGEYLTHLHISDRDGSFRGDWYSGKYDSKFIGGLKVAYLEDRIESVKKIYLKEEL